MNNRRLVSETLLPAVENVLKRRAIPYKMEKGSDGKFYCLSDLSANNFHKIIVRAKMEKETEEQGLTIPYISKTEMDDYDVIEELNGVFVVHE